MTSRGFGTYSTPRYASGVACWLPGPMPRVHARRRSPTFSRGDLVERAAAPTVERPPPHRPVGRRRVPEHGVGDGDEVGGGLRTGDGRGRGQGDQGGGDGQRGSHGSGLVRHQYPSSTGNRSSSGNGCTPNAFRVIDTLRYRAAVAAMLTNWCSS